MNEMDRMNNSESKHRWVARVSTKLTLSIQLIVYRYQKLSADFVPELKLPELLIRCVTTVEANHREHGYPVNGLLTKSSERINTCLIV